jgi:hypothetical protein
VDSLLRGDGLHAWELARQAVCVFVGVECDREAGGTKAADIAVDGFWTNAKVAGEYGAIHEVIVHEF